MPQFDVRERREGEDAPNWRLAENVVLDLHLAHLTISNSRVLGVEKVLLDLIPRLLPPPPTQPRRNLTPRERRNPLKVSHRGSRLEPNAEKEPGGEVVHFVEPEEEGSWSGGGGGDARGDVKVGG